MDWRSNFLGQLFGGDTLKDYQHAARLYTDDIFRLAPKNKFLYHVVFNFNPTAVGLSAVSKSELGMLVKRCDLPQYSFNVEMKNSYNYKNYITTGVTYQPVNITLHDDMGDVATAFFKSYYAHYFSDTTQAPEVYQKVNANFNTSWSSKYSWGRNSNAKSSFLNSISIFQLNRQRFTEYRMMNPIITDFNNGSMDQTDGTGIGEQTFSISYSGVLIEAGTVSRDNPQGFAQYHYDNSPSPNSPLGGGADSIFGVIGGAGTALSLLGQGNILGAALAAGNVYTKLKSGRAVSGAKEEITGIVKDAIKTSGSNLGATSKPGIRFPKNERTKSPDAQLKGTAKGNLLTNSIGNQMPQAKENLSTSLDVSDGKFKLTPQQISTYLNLDTVAKTKFTKFVSFRTSNNLALDQVETEWTKLSASEKTSYENQAITDAVNLAEQGLINYNVDQEIYNQVISTQVA